MFHLAPPQVQLVARVLHVCANAGPSSMDTPTQMDMHTSLLGVLEAAAALLVPWAAQLSTPVGTSSAQTNFTHHPDGPRHS